MVGDRDLLTFRQGYYDLLVSLLSREPSAEVLAALAVGIEERIAGARELHAALATGWSDVARALGEIPCAALADVVADEYTRLFLGPRGPEVNPYESFYLAGRMLDRPLATLRESLGALGIARREECVEPEDFLAFELDVMRSLLGRQAGARTPEEERRWVDAQMQFLEQHLLVWGPTTARDLAAATSARFYRGVAGLLLGFFALEEDLVREWGHGGPVPLEEARRSFARTLEWRGPIAGPEAAPGPDRQT